MKLSKAEKRAFGRQLVEFLTDKASELSEAGFDPATRITQCEALNKLAEQIENGKLVAVATKLEATRASNKATSEAYTRASSEVKIIEGYLGKVHELVRQLHQIRAPHLTVQMKRDFVRQIAEFLTKQTQFLSDAGYSTANSISELTELADTANNKAIRQLVAKANSVIATAASNAALGEVYNLVSATIELIAGILGEEHTMVRQLRALRHQCPDPPRAAEASPTGE